jgi:5-methylcytosine-specific restriction endonuclease McrA
MKNKVVYDRSKYLEYLASSEWLIKKSKLVSQYLRRKWLVSCSHCNSQKNLQVHHLTYKNIYKEKLSDLVFLCSICHEKRHKNFRQFKVEQLKKFDDAIALFLLEENIKG